MRESEAASDSKIAETEPQNSIRALAREPPMPFSMFRMMQPS